MINTYIPCFIIALLLGIVHNVEWYLKERPAVFGNDVHLVCKLPDKTCCHRYNRKWRVGTDYEFQTVVMNEVLQNKTKYIEELNVIDRLSMLTIKSFDENDINKVYVCSYGFLQYEASLQLDNHSFEYHPNIKLPIDPIIDGKNISVNVHFWKVYPLPVCRAELGLKNLSSFLKITKKPLRLFYQSDISLYYIIPKEGCKGSLKISCHVGQKELKVLDNNKVCSEDFEWMLYVIPPAFFIVLVSIVVVVNLRRYRLKKNEQRQEIQEMTNQPCLNYNKVKAVAEKNSRSFL